MAEHRHGKPFPDGFADDGLNAGELGILFYDITLPATSTQIHPWSV